LNSKTYQFGPVTDNRTTRFSLWAPKCDQVDLVFDEDKRYPMTPGDGWHFCELNGSTVGKRYSFRLSDGRLVPDPASRYQPFDVHGPSEIVASSHDWKVGWNGRPWHEAIIYELHIGAFTTEGTFKAAIGRLDYLSNLGITAIEIMPVADFPGAMMEYFSSRQTRLMEGQMN
jgi:maltooligosyltrehalose trehalohydrolase